MSVDQKKWNIIAKIDLLDQSAGDEKEFSKKSSVFEKIFIKTTATDKR